jgi:starch-binding outer membrane protein, SusD/RagB family
MKHIFQKTILMGSAAAIALVGCSKLEENLTSTATQTQAGTFLTATADLNVLLQSCYDGLQVFQNQDGPTSLMENSSDESLVPTRAGDWDDNGVWRVIHNHTWNADHAQVNNVFNGLLGLVFNTTNVLNFTANSTAANAAQVAAEARFIRAFAMFTVLDLYGQVPFRQPGEDLRNPPTVLTGEAAATFILSELTAIKPSLPNSTGPAAATRATKDACDMLSMKVLLQKGTYGTNRTPTFAAADMASVISLADGIINSGRYSLDPNVFDNYAPNNSTASSENIFTNQNIGAARGGNARSSWYKTQHYNQNKSGWNGFTTLAEVYDKFEAADQRRGVAYPANNPTITNPGNRINTGFLIGQQYNLATDAALRDRLGNPLAFTRTVALQENGANLEVTGIRVNRYPIDYAATNDDQAENDYVFYRYADVLLMKAEAQFRSSNAAGALTTLAPLRAIRGATPLASVTASVLLDERQREFYWDGWRRMDMVRFGTFLNARTLKPAVSDNKYLYYPIPNGALAVNPNLKQNPGY